VAKVNAVRGFCRQLPQLLWNQRSQGPQCTAKPEPSTHRWSNAVARHVVKYRVPQVGSQMGRFVADRFAVQRVYFLLKVRK
jgi:hypothetical protein